MHELLTHCSGSKAKVDFIWGLTCLRKTLLHFYRSFALLINYQLFLIKNLSPLFILTKIQAYEYCCIFKPIYIRIHT